LSHLFALLVKFVPGLAHLLLKNQLFSLVEAFSQFFFSQLGQLTNELSIFLSEFFQRNPDVFSFLSSFEAVLLDLPQKRCLLQLPLLLAVTIFQSFSLKLMFDKSQFFFIFLLCNFEIVDSLQSLMVILLQSQIGQIAVFLLNRAELNNLSVAIQFMLESN